MAFRLHHCHKSCRWLVAYTDREQIAQVTQSQSNKVKGAWRAQHPKCSDNIKNVAWLHQDVQEQASDFFFVSFYSASCLSLGDLVERCLGQPVDVQAPWPSAAVIPRRRRLSPEELGRVGERSLGSGWTATGLSCGDTDFFFFFF